MTRQVTTSLLRIATLGVLARQLTPEAFGLVALANVVLRLITMFSEGGIGTYVVYYREADWKEHARAAFWFNFATTVGQVLVCLAFLPVVVSIYDERHLVPVFLAMLWVFFVQQAGVVPMALLQRDLRFRAAAGRDMAAGLLSACLGIALALRGWGVWSLVVPGMIVEPIRVLVAVLVTRWVPGFRLRLSLWSAVFRYVKHLMASNFLQLVLNDGDTLLVGRLFNSGALGLYNLAWQLANLVGRNVTSVVGEVGLAALAESNSSRDRLQQNYLRMLRVLASVAFPALLFLFVAADHVVTLVYGPKYEATVPILRVFLIFTLVRSVTSPIGVLFNVLGRPGVGLALTAATVPPYIVAIIVGSRWNLVGVAAGVAAVRIAGAMTGWAISLHLLEASFVSAAKPFLRLAVAATIMGVAAWVAMAAVEEAGGHRVLATAASAIVALVTYGISVRVVDRQSWIELTVILRSMLPRRLRAI